MTRRRSPCPTWRANSGYKRKISASSATEKIALREPQENPDSHVRALSFSMEMHYFFARTHVVVVLLYS